MTHTSSTADRIELSYREIVMMPASIAQACRMRIGDTNISEQTAERRGLKNRTKSAQVIGDAI